MNIHTSNNKKLSFQNIFRIVIILTTLISSGCIDTTLLVFVRKNGSGYIQETTYNAQSVDQLIQQAVIGKTETTSPPINIEQYKARTSKIGSGVKFVSAKKITNAKGWEGVQAIYSFTDIRLLKVNPDAAPQVEQNTLIQAPASHKQQDLPITFGFTQSSSSKLTISMPKVTLPEGSARPTPPPPAQLAMMKQMCAGMRIRIVIRVDGEISKSNATYVQSSQPGGKKQMVALFEMEMDKIPNDNQTLGKIANIMQSPDITSAATALNNIPGIEAETVNPIEIEFR